MTLIIGDNYGLNGILGFTESFNGTNWCRVCEAPSNITERFTEERTSYLRNKENYEENENSSTDGIKELCVFHEITNFHITENISVDFMHDLLEGVCVYVMTLVIFELIFTKKYFTLVTLNSRINSFPFNNNSNKPPEISKHRLSKDSCLKMSASEMLTLVRFFGLIVGDLILNKNDECWQLCKYLRQIIDLLTSPLLISSTAKQLKLLIKNDIELHVKLFGSMKPKFHNLVHYPEILLNNGPCINFWYMRFQSRHRDIKANAQSTNCNKNLLVTIATKQKLQFASIIQTFDCKTTVVISSRQDDASDECYKKSRYL